MSATPTIDPAAPGDAAAVAELVVAVETSLYGRSTFAQADLEDEWSEIDLEHAVRVVREGDRIVGYGALVERGGRWRADGYVHPSAVGCGIGRLIATGLERDAAARGAQRLQSSVFEQDAAARELLESLGYEAVRVFRELRIELETKPAAPEWPAGLRAVPFDPARDAVAFHAAIEEAFADHWEHRPRDFHSWSTRHLGGGRFDPSLWCVVRSADEIAAGTICTTDTYGGGWIHGLFTRRPWRRRGVGAALLLDAFGRFWDRGERNVGLGVDAASETGAFRVYERAGMSPVLGWVFYEKTLGRSS